MQLTRHKLGVFVALSLAGVVVGADMSRPSVEEATPSLGEITLSLDEIKAEKIDDYKHLKDATPQEVVLKTHIKKAILDGTDPQFPSDIIAPHIFARLSVEVATEMGVDMNNVAKRMGQGEIVLLSKEIRIKAKEKGLEVKPLQK